MKMRGHFGGSWLAVVALGILAFSSGSAASQARANAENPQEVTHKGLNPQDLVRRAADFAVKSALDPTEHYLYRVKKETNSGIAVRDMIETRDVILARTITWNGRVLTAEERALEDAKLDRLLTDTEELHSKQAEQNADRERMLKFVRALPDALIYTLGGPEIVRGREAIRLTFTPNPNFSPPTRETYGLKAAAGTLWIDKETERIVRMQARLTENVYIGWGLLGQIDKGGALELEQTLLNDGRWRITLLNIDATGKIFFFKSIRIKQRQSGWDYRPMPPDLTINKAVEMLKKQETVVVQKGPIKK